MSQKIIYIDPVGEVVLQKRKGAQSVRLSVAHDGTLKVTLPYWSPFKIGEAFVQSKLDWIIEQKAGKQKHLIGPNDRIGKGHRVKFIHEHRANITSRITKTELIIRLPFDIEPLDDQAQKVVKAGAIRALKQEAKNLLPMRLKTLAEQHGFSYKSVTIKQLKSRWGSCSSQKDIALNCYLMQLPWELIDYVLLHELLHTQIMAHGQPFWTELGKHIQNLPEKRKSIKAYQPTLQAQV